MHLELFKKNDTNQKFSIVGFFTENFKEKAIRLIQSLDKHNLKYKIFKIPHIHFSKSVKGNLDYNYSQPNLILKCLDNLNEPVVYVDCDMVFLEYPELFSKFNKIDFAIYNWLEDKENDAYQLVKVQNIKSKNQFFSFYKRTHSVDYFNLESKQLISSGSVSYHSNSEISKKFLKDWQNNIRQYPKCPDDKILDYTYNFSFKFKKKLNTFWFKKNYCRYLYWIFTKPIINHPDSVSHREFSMKNFYNLDQFDENKLGIRRKKIDFAFCLIDPYNKKLYRIMNNKIFFLRNFKEQLFI